MSVIVPAYNEEDSVGQSLERLYREMVGNFERFEIILVSDGSTDRTIMRAQDSVKSSLRIVELPSNVGKGGAIAQGAQHARYDLVAFCDADLDLHPEMLTPMIRAVQDGATDVAVGSKRHPESSVNYPRWRRVQSAVYQRLCRILFSLDISDTQTGQKAMRKRDLELALAQVDTPGFAFDLDLLVALHDQGNRITEFPIMLTYAYSSTVSMGTAVTVAQETIRLWRKQRPSRSLQERD